MIEYLVGTGGWAYFTVPNKHALKAYSEIFSMIANIGNAGTVGVGLEEGLVEGVALELAVGVGLNVGEDGIGVGFSKFGISESASESKVMMHDDFVEIRAAFIKVYGKQQGGKEFKLWLQQNGLHPTHSYGRRWRS